VQMCMCMRMRMRGVCGCVLVHSSRVWGLDRVEVSTRQQSSSPPSPHARRRPLLYKRSPRSPHVAADAGARAHTVCLRIADVNFQEIGRLRIRVIQ